MTLLKCMFACPGWDTIRSPCPRAFSMSLFTLPSCHFWGLSAIFYFLQAIDKDAKYFRVQDKSHTNPKMCLCIQLHYEVVVRQLHVPESGAYRQKFLKLNVILNFFKLKISVASNPKKFLLWLISPLHPSFWPCWKNASWLFGREVGQDKSPEVLRGVKASDVSGDFFWILACLVFSKTKTDWAGLSARGVSNHF